MTDNTAGRVTSETDGHVVRITIDNVAKRNSFTPEMMLDLSAALTAYEDGPARVAVLCAAGDHFTAGLDMPRFFGPTATFKGIPNGQVDPFGLGRTCAKPLVSAVQGIVYTIGIEIMLAGDIVIAADTARFAQIEAKRGIAPLGGAHFRFLSRTGWGNAMYHLMLCDEFGAERAREIGLVQEVVPHGRQVERAMEVAHAIARNAPLGIRATKESALTYVAAAQAAAIAAVPAIHARVMGTADALEGIRSFLERREARFEGR
jgi:enoyl-CoA hydratase/carnithine racemase